MESEPRYGSPSAILRTRGEPNPMLKTLFSKFLPLGVVMTLILAACGGGEIGASESASASEAPSSSEGVAPSEEPAFPEGDIALELWTKEGDPQIAYVQALAEAYSEEHPNVTIDVVNKDVELLREDLVNTALSPDAAPELVWTVADHVGPFTAADVIQPLDDMDLSVYDEQALSAVQVDGTTWGIPISNGNQLMLYWNKSLAGDEAPADTDALIATAKENTSGTNYGLVFNETESFWLTPWLGGFGTQVFGDDGVTPTLDTPEMQAALQFLYDLKYTDKVMPAECDYTCASDLFTSGAAAFIVNGDWELGNYADQLGDDLGVGPLPTVSSTGDDPAPYTAGAFYMVPSAVEGDTLTVHVDPTRLFPDPKTPILELGFAASSAPPDVLGFYVVGPGAGKGTELLMQPGLCGAVDEKALEKAQATVKDAQKKRDLAAEAVEQARDASAAAAIETLAAMLEEAKAEIARLLAN